MPASRSAALTGPDLMNCGRFPTTDRTFTGARLPAVARLDPGGSAVYRRGVKVAGLLCALVLAAALAACGGAGFNPDPVFPVGPISGSASREVLKLGHVASRLAGKHAFVNCWSNKSWARLQAWNGSHDGTALVDAVGTPIPKVATSNSPPVVCQILGQVIDRSAQQPLFTAWAVTVLAHESAHASGVEAENRAECRAIKTEPRAAELLGIPKALARRLQHIYRGTIYPYDLPRYRIPTCSAGQPGAVGPDTLGTAANLRPLAPCGDQGRSSFPHWRGSAAY